MQSGPRLHKGAAVAAFPCSGRRGDCGRESIARWLLPKRADAGAINALDLHWHDLRHEGACRLLAALAVFRYGMLDALPALPTQSSASSG